jgi:hypothetical protein
MPEEVFRGNKRSLSNIDDLITYSRLTDEEYETFDKKGVFL